MSQKTILYISHDGGEADIYQALRRELVSASVRPVTPPLSAGEVEDAPDCIVYELSELEEDAFEHFRRIRDERSEVPIVLVVPRDSQRSLTEFLEAEHTLVCRRSTHSEEGAVLANRVETLAESYRRDKRLERERGRFETLFEVLTHPIVETEFEGDTPVIVRVNRAFEETLGYDETKLLGESLDEVIVPPEYQDDAREINSRVLNGEVFSVEVIRQTTDGVREFLLQNAVYPDSERDFAIYIDITDRKQRERELQEIKEQLESSNEQLKRKNARLDQFASVVSHDLRNPLNIAQIHAEAAEKSDDPDHFESIHDAHQRMATMITELLTIARTASSIDETTQVSLSEQVQLSWQTSETPGAELNREIPRDVELEVDPTLFQHILENLFRNAIEHNDPPVAVSVGLLEDGSGFYVEDDGDGIPPKERERVFEHGYTTASDGIGFGLSIVEEFVTLHGWEISVTESDTGSARFEIRTDTDDSPS